MNVISHYQNKPQLKLNFNWFDKNGRFAYGKEFCIDQPSFNLALCPVGKLDLIESTWEKSGVTSPENFNILKWLNKKLAEKGLVAAPSDWISKKVLGIYLQEMLNELQFLLSDSISIFIHSAEVKKIQARKEEYELICSEDEKFSEEVFQRIKIGVAKYPVQITSEEETIINFSSSSRQVRYYGNPKRNTDNFKEIRLTDQVLISATNEFFFNCLFAVTEGRGGEFYVLDGMLIYEKSGNEPMSIFPFFPFGLPYLTDPYHKPPPYKFKFLTEQWENDLLNKAESIAINFEKEVFDCFIMELNEVADIKIEDQHQNFLVAYFSFVLDHSASHNQEFHQMALESFVKLITGNPCTYVFSLAEIWNKVSLVIKKILLHNDFSDKNYNEFCSRYKHRFDWLTLQIPPIYIFKIIALAEARILFFRLGNDTIVHGDLMRGMFIASSYQSKYEKHANIYIDTAGIYNVSLKTDTAFFELLKKEDVIDRKVCFQFAARGYLVF